MRKLMDMGDIYQLGTRLRPKKCEIDADADKYLNYGDVSDIHGSVPFYPMTTIDCRRDMERGIVGAKYVAEVFDCMEEAVGTYQYKMYDYAYVYVFVGNKVHELLTYVFRPRSIGPTSIDYDAMIPQAIEDGIIMPPKGYKTMIQGTNKNSVIRANKA